MKKKLIRRTIFVFTILVIGGCAGLWSGGKSSFITYLKENRDYEVKYSDSPKPTNEEIRIMKKSLSSILNMEKSPNPNAPQSIYINVFPGDLIDGFLIDSLENIRYGITIKEIKKEGKIKMSMQQMQSGFHSLYIGSRVYFFRKDSLIYAGKTIY
jgi:hypothetical protein